MNKGYYMAILIGTMALSSYGQAITPFADLSDQNRTLFGNASRSAKSDYHNYPTNYRNALMRLDNEIQEVEETLKQSSSRSNEENLQRKRAELLSKKELLIDEAGLFDDLHEFY